MCYESLDRGEFVFDWEDEEKVWSRCYLIWVFIDKYNLDMRKGWGRGRFYKVGKNGFS